METEEQEIMAGKVVISFFDLQKRAVCTFGSGDHPAKVANICKDYAGIKNAPTKIVTADV